MEKLEQWKPVGGAPGYEVSSLGQVRRAGKVLKPYLNKRTGRHQYKISFLGDRSTVRAAQLVAIHFLPPRPTSRHELDHINGVKTDNRAVNLEWVTHKENMERAYAKGLRIPKWVGCTDKWV